MLICKLCGRQFHDDENGSPRDQLDVHITDVHPGVYEAMIQDVFVAEPGDVDQLIEALATEGR